MRTSLVTTWGALAVILVVGGGAVAASSGYRRIAGMDERAVQAETALREREALIAQLASEVEALRAQVAATRLESEDVRAALRTTQRLLKDTTEELRQREERIGAQQSDIDTLWTCLTGSLHALQTMANGDAYGAMHYMVAVDDACRAAHRLLNLQGAGN